MEYKIVVLGSPLVGKSALINRFTRDHFESDYIPTLEDSYRKTVYVESESCLLDIVDTGGGYSFSEDQIRRADGFLCVFAINDLESFEQVSDYIKKVRLVKPDASAPIVLVGNKTDEKREVHQLLAEARAAFFDVYVETSAKHNKNVDEAFFRTVLLIRWLKDVS